MEGTELVKRLEQLDLQVWDVTEEVARQRKVITQLDAVGMDTSDAQLLLSRRENLLIILLQEREKMRTEVAKLVKSHNHLIASQTAATNKHDMAKIAVLPIELAGLVAHWKVTVRANRRP
jgi:hypothetical protein